MQSTSSISCTRKESFMLPIVTATKQKWIKHHQDLQTELSNSSSSPCKVHSKGQPNSLNSSDSRVLMSKVDRISQDEFQTTVESDPKN